jgi:hypothetical protein
MLNDTKVSTFGVFIKGFRGVRTRTIVLSQPRHIYTTHVETSGLQI